MTDQQEEHLKSVAKAAAELIESKYRKGQEEHGGNLFDLTSTQLLNEALMEVTDLFVYLLTVKQKISDIKEKYDVR